MKVTNLKGPNKNTVKAPKKKQKVDEAKIFENVQQENIESDEEIYEQFIMKDLKIISISNDSQVIPNNLANNNSPQKIIPQVPILPIKKIVHRDQIFNVKDPLKDDFSNIEPVNIQPQINPVIEDEDYENLPNLEPPNSEIRQKEAIIEKLEIKKKEQENVIKKLNAEIDQKKQEYKQLKQDFESILNLTLNFSSYLDTKALIQSENAHWILREAQALSQSIKNDKRLQIISENTEKAVMCSYCAKNLSEVILSCTHSYCQGCIYDLLHWRTDGLYFLTTYEKNNRGVFCRVCNKSIEEDDIKNIISIDVWQDWEKARDQRQIEQKSRLESSRLCQKCNINKDISLFYHRDTCKHMCKECILESISEGKTRCTCLKNFAFTQIAKQELGTCDGCKQELSYVYDYLTTLCDGHKHCKKCMKEVYETNMSCKICQKQLNGASYEKLMKVIQRQCENCHQCFEKEKFVKKPCCDSNICLMCQSQEKNNVLCMVCNNQLDNAVCKQIQDIAKLRDNMLGAAKILDA